MVLVFRSKVVVILAFIFGNMYNDEVSTISPAENSTFALNVCGLCMHSHFSIDLRLCDLVPVTRTC